MVRDGKRLIREYATVAVSPDGEVHTPPLALYARHVPASALSAPDDAATGLQHAVFVGARHLQDRADGAVAGRPVQITLREDALRARQHPPGRLVRGDGKESGAG